jgi:TatA/E family protein of Tat protein translocase
VIPQNPSNESRESIDVFGTFGVTEILLIVLFLTLLFGAKKIPIIARGLGEGIRNFRASVKEGQDDEGKRLPGSGESEED